MRSNIFKRKLIATTWMLVGSSLVFALLLIMNEFIDTPKPSASLAPAEFSVDHPKQKKPKQKRQKPKPKNTRSHRAPRPAAPQLAGSLSGFDFGLPQFDASTMSGINDSILGNMGDVVMTEDSVDNPPRPRQRGRIEYPKRAREKGITGYVTLSVLINENGNVERVKVLESDPPGVFEEAAISAISGWSFDAATYKEKPVRIWAKQTLRFDLK
jgi:protein TonB